MGGWWDICSIDNGIPPTDAWKVYPRIGLKGLVTFKCRGRIPRIVRVTSSACLGILNVSPASVR